MQIHEFARWAATLATLTVGCRSEADPERDAAPPDAAPPPDDLGVGPDFPRPDAALTCTLFGTDLGLTLSPLPPSTTGGTLVSLQAGPEALTFTLRDRDEPEATYTLTGPFAELPADALPVGTHVALQVSGAAFVVRAGPCGQAPFEVAAGSWTDLEPLLGPLERYPTQACGSSTLCPRPFTHPIDPWRVVEPGATDETVQRRITVGRNEGCPEDPQAPSRLEYVAIPRRDAPSCAGPAPYERPPSFEMSFTLPPPLDTPERRTHLDFLGEVAIEFPAVAPGNPPVVRLVPQDTADAPTAIELAWSADMPPPSGPFASPIRAQVRAIDAEFVLGDAVEVTDADGLVFMAVRGDRGWVDQRQVDVLTRQNRPECLSRVEQAPGVVEHWEGHSLEFQFYEYEGQSAPSAFPGDTEVELAGRRYRLDARASHALPDSCTTDAVSGWVDFVLTRAE